MLVSKPRVHVAVGVIRQGSNVLLAERQAHLHQGGLWEFPGGKVEPGESVGEALVRELHEELGITIDSTQLRPLIRVFHDYADKLVLLDVHEISSFEGEPHGQQGQPVFWQSIHELPDHRFPAANVPIIRALRLPDRCMITGDAAEPAGIPLMLAHALRRHRMPLAILRCPSLSLANYRTLATQCIDIARQQNALLLIHDHAELVGQLSADGLHVSQRVARTLTERPVAPNRWFSVSCHNAEELAHAQQLGADFVLLSPVLPTLSHPEVLGMGWSAFAEWCERSAMPVFAMGGVGDCDIDMARQHGAQGVAGIRAWWPTTL